jgi:hypothetical protein
MLATFGVFAVLLSGHTRAQQVVTYAFSGVMEGSSIFSEGTPFTGSFTYSYPQEPNTGGTYRLQSYNLTIQGQSQPITGLGGGIIITSGSGVIGFPGGAQSQSLPGTTWNGATTSYVSPITITDGSPDIFSVSILRFYTLEAWQGRLLIYGPSITLSDSTGRIFDNVNLPDISVLQDRFTSGSIRIGYEVVAFSSAEQTGRITSLAPVTLVTNSLLGLEKSSNAGGPWTTVDVSTDMITPEGQLNVGTLTNEKEFYRLKIRTIVK